MGTSCEISIFFQTTNRKRYFDIIKMVIFKIMDLYKAIFPKSRIFLFFIFKNSTFQLIQYYEHSKHGTKLFYCYFIIERNMCSHWRG